MSVAHLHPVNKTAALVVSKGVEYKPDCKVQVKEFIGPPPIVLAHKHPRTATFADLTGRKKGRFVVIGLMQGSGGKWVVKCACGTYTTRSSKSIKSADTNPKAHFDACRECMHLAHLKRAEIFRRTGKGADISEVW